jgi:hypothetical protein
MSASDLPFNRGAVRPTECIGVGWRLIKEQYWLFLGITFVGTFVGSLAPMGILLGPAMCGIYLCLLRRWQGQLISFDMLFEGFNCFVQSLIATLIMVVPMMVLMVPLYVGLVIGMMLTAPHQAQGAPPDPSVPLALLAILGLFFVGILLISFVIGILFCFTYPLIVDRKLSGWEAVKMSFRAAFGNLGGLIGLALLNWLLTFAGLLCCYVGAIFVMPLTFAALCVAYRQVFPLEQVPSVLATTGIR